MTLRQLNKKIEEALKMLEKEYGKGADVDLVIFNPQTDILQNGIDLFVGWIDYSDYEKDINSFPYPVDGESITGVLTYGNCPTLEMAR